MILFKKSREIMKLSDYLKKNGLTHDAFSKKVNVTRPMITFLVNRTTNPSVRLIKRIENETKGEVSFHDLLTEDTHRKTQLKPRKENKKTENT